MEKESTIYDEFYYFCSRLNLGASALDNRAIRFMNEFPSWVVKAIKESKE